MFLIMNQILKVKNLYLLSKIAKPDLNINQRSHQGLGTSRGGNKSTSSERQGTFSIDVHQLTGKIGLERMMTFLDSKSPPIKGNFEYKAKHP